MSDSKVDKNYIENLIFRLNNDKQVGYRAGYELTDGCSKFSVESISDTLKFFLAGLKTRKGIERNLLAKRFLPNILYSPESIKIRFVSRQSEEGVALAERSPAPLMAGLGERTLSSENSRFVSYLMAPGVGIEPTTNGLHVSPGFPEGWTISSSSWDAGRFVPPTAGLLLSDSL